MRTTFCCLILFALLAAGVPAAWCASASVADTGSITIAAAGITYIAHAGDTLSSIAQQFTTKRENWAALGKLNHIGQDSNIPIGTAIQIPAALLADEPSEAKVVALSGNVTASVSGDSWSALGLGAKITQGMQINTGSNSFLTLALPDASRISLPSNSRIKLSKLRVTRYTNSPRTEITLLRGRVESRVSPLESNQGRFEVRSRLAVAGVRGTHFRVGMGAQGITNEVLSGSVVVGMPKSPDALTLGAAKGNMIDADTVGKPVDLLPAPRLAGYAAAQEYPATQFTLSKVDGAGAYHLQISTDQEAQNILAETRSAGNQLKIDGITDGDYFVRISAIDKSGLEGLTDTQAVTLKAGAQTARKKLPHSSAPFVDDSDDKEISLRWLAQSGKKFIVQVAHDADFTWLLFTANTSTPEVRLPRPAFGTYYARVQAIGAEGTAHPFSLVQAFIVTDHWVINDGSPGKMKETPPTMRH